MSSAEQKVHVDIHHETPPAPKKKGGTNPIVILLGILFFASFLTYFIPSGEYARDGKLVVPGSYHTIEKETSPSALFALGPHSETEASPVSLIETLLAIPEGLERSGGLIFMVLIIGGMFGIIKQSGAIDVGLERLLSLVKGNVYVLIPGLMIVFSAGSTFLGLASEYLLIIPVMVALANRMGMSNIMGLAIVTVSVKIGYIASVTNPLPLTIAQPLLGLPIFSGAGFRFAAFCVFLIIGILFMLWMARKSGYKTDVEVDFSGDRLSLRQQSMLWSLVVGIGFLVYASSTWQWKHENLTAYYIALSILLAVLSGLGASAAADAFVSGMKKVLMASFLIGVATAVSVVLQKGQILDTIVSGMTGMIGEDNPMIAASGMFFSQLFLDFLIPSTSGQAAVSMPILGPIGQITGVTPQTTVLAFLFGNTITNMLTPTSGTLLAYLATAQVGWTAWARFIVPLWAIFIVVSLVLLSIAVMIQY
ncbi:hypothetical protein GCM10017044_09800 [Kordiimonas sediminis]|uniref:C4-dicarboxylate ABC transporter n=1 Tax=Kordiimonas sediminis TaxID=1735581 RepID=A0A919E6C7_9PROT|nr:YfcC family protein [Kordiimonas sediminis]GHF17464.1 hypothetical protein GCM10017044_09800 [Kordiimonas sediminis]